MLRILVLTGAHKHYVILICIINIMSNIESLIWPTRIDITNSEVPTQYDNAYRV